MIHALRLRWRLCWRHACGYLISLVGVVLLPPTHAAAQQESETVAQSSSFVNDVVPILSRYGCNAGGCHGAARGKDGFQLSLFGYDPKGDYHSLIRELPGRRVDLALPSDSLLLAKATGSVHHTGGKRMDESSEHYQRLLRWIGESAEFDGDSAPKVDRVTLSPTQIVMQDRADQPLTVTAYYSDDTERDVTSLATFSINDSSIATISAGGQLVAQTDGEAFVMARFDAHTVGSTVIVQQDNSAFRWPKNEPDANYIDSAINNKLRKLRISPTQVCSDADFLRRVSIDLSGRLPTPAELNAFVADPNPRKRAQQIDQKLAASDFERLWTMKWLELLKVRTINNKTSKKATWKFAQWLKQNIHANVPIDRFVTTLLTASGSDFDNPPATFFQSLPNQKQVAEDVAQVFLGMRIQCAQCHNHPFDRWTMDDYYGFVAFFNGLRRQPGSDPRERIVYQQSGRTLHPVTKQPVAPRFLGGAEPDVSAISPRQALADWITSPNNPYFARNLANRLWQHFFDAGVVDEVDDIRISNPPVNEELLDQLAQRLVDANFDFKSLARDICNSRAYQRSTGAADSNLMAQRNFAQARLRRIRAEVLLDVISQVTETINDFAGLPRGASATEIPDGTTTVHFLTTFGRAPRTTACACEVKTEPNLSQALHLINGETVQQKILDGKVIERMLDAKKSDRQIVHELYLRCLSREPTDDESVSLSKELFDSDDHLQTLRDLFWALLNSREFLFNH